MLYRLDSRGRGLWSSRIGGPGRESGRWIAKSDDEVWVVSQVATPLAGSSILVIRMDLRRR